MIENVDAVPFSALLLNLYDEILSAPILNVGEWQGQLKADAPQAKTAEVLNVTFAYAIPKSLKELVYDVEPHLPWAEDHFMERISGTPHNPPPSSAHWPFAVQGHVQHVDQYGRFSHTYPERLWPRGVWDIDRKDYPHGVRFPLGDLNDVVWLLRNRPFTRQAYLPIWFPEDTGAVEEQRVPCTLGYHFIIREHEGRLQLQITYYIRSCDIYRHFKDDVYMACRLAQWMAAMVATRVEGLQVGQLLMHITSLHAFEVDLPILQTLRKRMGE